PVRRDAGEPGQAFQREEGTRPAVHRLADLGRRSEGNSRLQYRGRTAFLPERSRSERLMIADASGVALVPGYPAARARRAPWIGVQSRAALSWLIQARNACTCGFSWRLVGHTKK